MSPNPPEVCTLKALQMKDLKEVECQHLKCPNYEIERVRVVRPSAERVDITQPNDDLKKGEVGVPSVGKLAAVLRLKGVWMWAGSRTMHGGSG